MSWLITSTRGDSNSETSPTSSIQTSHNESDPPVSASSSSSSSNGALSIVINSPVMSVKVGVLLDGDADYFTRAYTSKGRQGGRCAAIELKNNVERYIRKEFFGNAKDIRIEIVAFSFLNMKGLSNFLGDDMATFAQGFNSSPYAFSMSDVGDISQCADIALKSHLPFLLSTCDHVLFGGTHDNGYEEILANLAATGQRDKVILLRTTPYCAEKILMLGLEEVRFPLLFEERDPTERARRPSVFTGDHSRAASFQGGSSQTTPRAYSKVAATPLALPAPASPSIPSTPSLASTSQNYDYKPLVRLLLDRLTQQNPVVKPLRGTVAYELKCCARPPIDFSIPKEFRKYSLMAESRGLVQLGVGELEGSEWIKLAMSIEEAQEYVKGSEPISTALVVAQPSQPSFCVLVQVLRECPDGWATFSICSSRIVTRGSRPWGSAQFSSYAEKAVQARIVKTGRIEGEQFEFWIQLTPQYQISRSAPPSPATPRVISTRKLSSVSSSSALALTSTSGIPAKFGPLVNAFVTGRITSTTPHSLASRLTCHGNKPFESGKWFEYLDEARKLGIVKFSDAANGVRWITILRTR
ncbi:hypothetical protein JCM3765_005703 [Sporobolomyces pararoseus]